MSVADDDVQNAMCIANMLVDQCQAGLNALKFEAKCAVIMFDGMNVTLGSRIPQAELAMLLKQVIQRADEAEEEAMKVTTQ